MEFRVLAVGDAVGAPGLRFLQQKLRGIKRLYGVDFCVVNGENANVVGITPQQADAIFDAGAMRQEQSEGLRFENTLEYPS